MSLPSSSSSSSTPSAVSRAAVSHAPVGRPFALRALTLRVSPFALAFVAALAASTVQAAPATPKNGMLVDGQGRTLYVFKKDGLNTSQCYDGCAKAWPPFVVADPAKADPDFLVVERLDGVKQWSYKGQPLYTFAGDNAPGEANGENSGGVWFTVKTAGAPERVARQPSPYTY